MIIDIDLLENWKNLVFKEIKIYKSLGFKFPNYENEKEDNIIYDYLQFKNRLIPAKPRKIKYSKEFSCPPSLLNGLKLLEDEINKGINLLHRLSRKIACFNYNDGMLFEWGIQHFHLGTKPHKKRAFLTEGTNEILYAIYDDDFVYFLIIDDHDKFSSKKIFKIIVDNFPEFVEPYKSKYSSVDNSVEDFSEVERKKLREAGYNALTICDGDLYFPPGEGITSNGKSLKAYRKIDNIISTLNDAEKIIKEKFNEYFFNYIEKTQNHAEQYKFIMEKIENDKITVKDLKNNIIIKLNFRKDLRGFNDIIIENYNK